MNHKNILEIITRFVADQYEIGSPEFHLFNIKFIRHGSIKMNKYSLIIHYII